MTPAGCARCHRAVATAATWPDGRICRTCITRASRTQGRCPLCGTSRLLPGLAGDKAICRDCAGITRDFTCCRCGCRCGIEGLLTSGKICERCALASRLAVVLDDGSGRIAPALLPLRQALLEMPRPCAGLAWLRNRPALDLLTALATGALEHTHEALSAWPNRQAGGHLRDLLTSTGILPDRDPHLAVFESWLHNRLESLTGHPHLGVLRRYATFCLLPRLRAAAPGTLITGSARYAARAFTCGQAFCDWLQAAGISPGGLTQAGLDRWHTTASRTTAKMTSGFFGFAMTEGFLPRLTRPAHPAPGPTTQPISAAAPCADPLRAYRQHRPGPDPGCRPADPAVRPAGIPYHPAHRGRHHRRRHRGHVPAPGRPAHLRSRALRRADPPGSRRAPGRSHLTSRPLAVPRPERRTPAAPRHTLASADPIRHPGPGRPHRGVPGTGPASTRTRDRPGTRLLRHRSHHPRRSSRGHLEPLRRR